MTPARSRPVSARRYHARHDNARVEPRSKQVAPDRHTPHKRVAGACSDYAANSGQSSSAVAAFAPEIIGTSHANGLSVLWITLRPQQLHFRP